MYFQVTGVKNYTAGKLDTVKRYGVDTITYALETPYGKAVIDRVDGLLDNTEKYVDYYLPEDDGKIVHTHFAVSYQMLHICS